MASSINKTTFLALAQKARQTRNNMDIQNAINYGVSNNISTSLIRKALN